MKGGRRAEGKSKKKTEREEWRRRVGKKDS
jgi:hypothetical protein